MYVKRNMFILFVIETIARYSDEKMIFSEKGMI